MAPLGVLPIMAEDRPPGYGMSYVWISLLCPRLDLASDDGLPASRRNDTLCREVRSRIANRLSAHTVSRAALCCRASNIVGTRQPDTENPVTKRERLRSLIVEEARYVRRSMIFHRREFGGRERLETTITTEVVEDLRRRGRGLLHIDFAPNEKESGADIELWLRGGGFLLGLRLQAKSLHARKRSDGVYKYLHHVVGESGPNPRDQVDVLIVGTKAPLVPMYLYYNGLEKKPAGRSGCPSMNGYAKKNGRLGLTVSSAEFVQRWWPFGQPARRFSHILPHSVPLQCLAACDCPFSEVSPGALPLRALEWPLLAAGTQALLVRDPEFDDDGSREALLVRLRARGVTIYDGQVPRYVLDLARDGTLPREADVNAFAVAVVDGDRLDS